MASRPKGNAAKNVFDESMPPWHDWPETNRAERAIKFIERYCIAPKGYGAGKLIKLAPFQKEWLREVYAPGISSAAMELPRGNGKSTFLAAVAVHALFDDDDTGSPQVPVVATTILQAVRSVYGVAVAMVKRHLDLETRSLIYTGMGTQRIAVPYNDGEMFPVSNDPDGLQGLDPSLGVCDELGFMPIESWDSMLLASGKRPRSLVVGIGTPGFDRDNALWHLRYRAQSGEVLPGFLFTEYAAPDNCDIHDEALWSVANPALAAGYMNADALRTAVALSPEAHFRIFRLGQWVDGVECWLGTDGRGVWRSLLGAHEFVIGAPTWVGIDIGLKRDSTAIVACQRRPDRRLHVTAKIWLPNANGRLDVADAMRYLRDLDAMYDVKAMAYDPRFFDLPAQQLDDEGLPMIETPQTLEHMTPIVGATYEAIKRQEITHDDDSALEQQVLNAVARYNERGFILAKSKSKDRIDAAVALCMAVHSALVREKEKKMAMASFG